MSTYDRWQCTVCGSSAPVMRTGHNVPTLYLCYAHEYVCNAHLSDPCRHCDGGES